MYSSAAIIFAAFAMKLHNELYLLTYDVTYSLWSKYWKAAEAITNMIPCIIASSLSKLDSRHLFIKQIKQCIHLLY